MAITSMINEETKYAFRNAKASLEIEGQYLPEGGEEMILKSIEGEMSEADFLQRALKLARNE
ncbi:hypothetical protein M3212_17330 [Alkalihalobacillus oceani]|uniref:Antitoxin VbhA domain-containing protein n=1 Tax=Halalkalibacter oceani TaxID=1653776 RepID=A0A9X2DQZ6_9BACI|nr:hypothetical protein [Halalkalibacter oceani]MCM3714100.1 hypothetical protein [Halalkalibacter oceani]MCM3762535.1 hypothetical protein [Halalkalibacter oceani]